MPQDMHEGRIVCDRIAKVGQRHAIRLERHTLRTGDIVFSRRGDVTRFALVTEAEAGWLCGTGSIRIRLNSPEVLVGYVRRYLQQEAVGAWLIHHAKGVTMPNLNTSVIRSLPFVYPPLPEQQRIADILDRADALRAKRRAALALLDTLPQAIFVEMFGDPRINPMGWPQVTLMAVLSMPLRNGLSPSHAGEVVAKVLTLSAVTGQGFDRSAWKTSTFRSRPPSDQAVDTDDFLICRGNGNVELVGRGFFPTECMPDVTFPDTMIAARIRTDRLDRQFLQYVWNSGAVRRQIEAAARTTNGTFKVNQSILEEVKFIAPPLETQLDFAQRAVAVDKLKAAHRASLAEMDALFASLQHRAFRGEL